MLTLGYYDEDESQFRQPREKKGRFFLSSLIGAIIGALLVILAVPTLSNYGLLPYSVQPANQIQVPETKGNTTTTQNVSLKVSTDVTNAVEKAGDAVVGITNIQTTSFWSQDG